MRAQVSAARIADAEFLDQGGIAQSTLRQVVNAFRMAVQFELIKTRSVLEQLGCGCEFFPQVGDALAKGEMLGKLHQANQIPASATTVAVEQILARVDIEGGTGFLMQGTASDELGARASAMSDPVMPLQVLQQWNALFELFQILAHGGPRSRKPKLRTLAPSFQARMVGQYENLAALRDAVARRLGE